MTVSKVWLIISIHTCMCIVSYFAFWTIPLVPHTSSCCHLHYINTTLEWTLRCVTCILNFPRDHNSQHCTSSRYQVSPWLKSIRLVLYANICIFKQVHSTSIRYSIMRVHYVNVCDEFIVSWCVYSKYLVFISSSHGARRRSARCYSSHSL